MSDCIWFVMIFTRFVAAADDTTTLGLLSAKRNPWAAEDTAWACDALAVDTWAVEACMACAVDALAVEAWA